MKNQKGITLPELLAVLVLSSIVVIIPISIFTSMMKVKQTTIDEANIRNEAVLILQQLETAMENIDSIETEGNLSLFQNFQAVDKWTEIELNEKGEEVYYERQQITSIEINNENLFLNENQINSYPYTVTDSYFNLKNNGLYFILIVANKEQDIHYRINKLYTLQSE